MTFEEFKKFYEENKGTTEVLEFVNGFNSVDLSKVKDLTRNDKELKSWLDSEKDKHYNVAFETWKANNLQKLIDEKVRQLYPEKSESEIEIEKLKLELENIKREKTREVITNKAIKELTNKNLPLELVDFFIAENEENTVENIKKIEQVFNNYKSTIIKDFDKSSHKPAVSGDIGVINPWAKETFNLTKQGELLRNQPDLARQLIKQSNNN